MQAGNHNIIKPELERAHNFFSIAMQLINEDSNLTVDPKQ